MALRPGAGSVDRAEGAGGGGGEGGARGVTWSLRRARSETTPALAPALAQGPAQTQALAAALAPGETAALPQEGCDGRAGPSGVTQLLGGSVDAEATVVEGEGGGVEGKATVGVNAKAEAKTWAGCWGSAAAAVQVVMAMQADAHPELRVVLVSVGRGTERLRVAGARAAARRARVMVGRHTIRDVPHHAHHLRRRASRRHAALTIVTQSEEVLSADTHLTYVSRLLSA